MFVNKHTKYKKYITYRGTSDGEGVVDGSDVGIRTGFGVGL